MDIVGHNGAAWAPSRAPMSASACESYLGALARPVPRYSHSAPPAAKRIKVPDAPRARSTPPAFINPERVFKFIRRTRDSRWTPTLGDRPSGGSYEITE